MSDLLGQAGLFAARDQMVDEHAEAGSGPGAEVVDHPGQVVDAVQPLDDHTLHPQVVAPYPLHQLGVVHPLDQDPADPGHPGPLPGHRQRP